MNKADEKEQTTVTASQELKSSLEFTKTYTDHISQFLTRFLGSMPFLIASVHFFLLWIIWNIGLLFDSKPFDPFPFPILNTIVSLFAIILSVSVLINQNRQGKVDKVQRQVEFEVNVRAENEITKVLSMLHEIHTKLGIDNSLDEELKKMKENIDVKEIHKVLEEGEQAESENKV
jgi:uncharacterized membrane protein